MRNLIRKWLGIDVLENRMLQDKKILNKQIRKGMSLDKQIREVHTKLNNLRKL